MRVASFFSGIGGFELGFERAGMEVVFQCEKNEFCQKVLKKHWPDIPLHKDIETLDPSNVPESDLYCGGFPCQDVSLANQGKRKGLKGERSGLFFKFAELIREREPKWVVIENVTGLLNSRSGQDFRVVVQTLDEIGYGVSWRVLDAKFFGTPQRRRRVFIVASHRSLRAATVLLDEQALAIPAKPSRGTREKATSGYGTRHTEPDLYTIQHASIGRKPSAGPQAKGYRNDGETWTLDSRGSSDALCATDDAFRIRKATGISQRLDSARYRALGNAVCVPVVEWIGRRIMVVEASDPLEATEFHPLVQLEQEKPKPTQLELF